MAPPDGTVTAPAVRDLLTAIAAVLDIPRPLYRNQDQVFLEVQRGRAQAVAQVLADRLTGPIDDAYLISMCGVLQMHATQPLGYTPRSPR